MLEAYDKDIKGIYNLGTGKTSSWNDLANNVFKALEKETNIEYIDIPADIANQYQNYTKAEMSKFHSAGFKTEFTSFENAVSDYVKNYLEKNKYI
jgi:ADP-L-glycero-D-manno-heptose 6-epimerase